MAPSPKKRPCEEVYTPTEQLSPELVLVLPAELAEQARAALPDRPWERFLDVSAAEPAATPRVEFRLRPSVTIEPVPAPAVEAPLLRPGPAEPVLRPGPAARRSAAAQERHRAVPRVAHRRMPVRRTRFSRLLAPVATIAFALAAVTWASEQTPPLTTVGGPSPPSTSPTPQVTIPPRAGASSPGSAIAGSSAPKSGSRATPSTRPAKPVPITPVALGGYVFPLGRLVVSANGTSLERLELAEFCSQPITISRLPVTARGTFAYSGPALKGRFRVTLSGRFLDSRRVRFSVLLRGPGCPARRVTVVGRLS